MKLKNVALSFALVLACVAGGVAVYQSVEIDANSYRMLRNTFKAGSPALKSQIAEAMASGQVSRWEYRGLQQQFAQAGVSIAVGAAGTNVAEERLVLAALTRQVKAP